MESPPTERVGKFEMEVAICPATPESRARWDRRVETLTMWLLKEYEATRPENKHVDCFSLN